MPDEPETFLDIKVNSKIQDDKNGPVIFGLRMDIARADFVVCSEAIEVLDWAEFFSAVSKSSAYADISAPQKSEKRLILLHIFLGINLE